MLDEIPQSGPNLEKILAEMPQVEHGFNFLKGPLPDSFGTALAVHQFPKVSNQVSPANLPLFGRKLGICRETIGDDESLKRPEEPIKSRLAPIGINVKNGQGTGNSYPEPVYFMFQKPTSLIDMDRLSFLNLFLRLLIGLFQGIGDFHKCEDELR